MGTEMDLKQRKIIINLALFSFFCFLISSASAATIYFFPQNIELIQGETALVEVRINTEGEILSAVDASGKINSDIAKIDSVDTSNALIKVFIAALKTGEQSFRFVGGTPNGFNGDNIIGRLNISGDMVGQTEIVFDDTSKAILNTEEQKESSIKFINALININERGSNQIQLTSRTHQNQENWAKDNTLNLHWDLEEGVEYSYLISLDPLAVPDDIPDKPEGNLMWMGDISISGLKDGIYYFTVKKVGDNPVSRYRAMVDTTAPSWIDVKLSSGVETTDNKKFVSFLAEDVLSGIDYYEIQIDGKQPERITSPYILPAKYKEITLKAFDRAGNSVEKNITYEYPSRALVTILISLIALSGIIFILAAKEKIKFPRIK
jgi:hypothetical protein